MGWDSSATRAALIRELAARVEAIGEHDTLWVVELAQVGVIIWKVGRYPNGTPEWRRWEPKPWLALDLDEAPDGKVALHVAMLREIALPSDGSPLMLVCSSTDGPRARMAYAALAESRPAAPAFICADPLRELLDEVLTNARLTLPYELVVLRLSPSGRLELGLSQLFPEGAMRGETAQVKVRCESDDPQGTVFAVVAVAPGRTFRLVSLRSARLAPGSYTTTAELRRPGEVHFNGLHASFSREGRSWSELIASLPRRLDLAQAAHLICMVESSGTDDELNERLHRVEQLIRLTSRTAARHVVSLISYGPHAVGSGMPEEAPHVWAWAASSQEALAEVDNLRKRGAAKPGYARAAQLECALTTLADRLDQRDKQRDSCCVVVTVGARPAFPSKRDPVTEIIPCPARRDWRTAVKRLRQLPKINFGVILDRDQDNEIWLKLGSDALIYGAPVDVHDFASRLGLVSRADVQIPFPLAESEGD